MGLRRIAFFVAAVLAGGSASADRLLQMPNGGTCWVNDVGHVYGCNGGQADNQAAQPKCRWVTEKAWQGCERRKTMPGQPSNCDHLLPKC